jgi:hypothetical protein
LVVVVTAAAVAMLLLPGPAAAAPVTIGQLAPGTAVTNCGTSPFDLVQPTVTSGNSYVVPIGGVVVTAWSTNVPAGAGQMLEMKVFRPAGGTNYTVVGHDGPRALTPSGVNTFSTRISVQAGDVLGDTIAGSAANACDFPVSGDTHPERAGDLADGSTGNFNSTSSNTRVNVTAVVRFLPAVSSVAPASGGIGGGTPVTISGHDFSDATAVSFGGVPASHYTVNSDSSITAVSPPESPGAVDVRVTTPAGQTAVTSTDRFTFATPAVPKCVVPRLKGLTLKKARKALTKSHCKLGKIKGPNGRKARIKKQKPKAGTVLKAGSKVKVTTTKRR